MCFAPQRNVLFPHFNVQTWSDNEVFLAFWLRNVLRATAACNFWSLSWPDGSAPAALASLLFDPPEPQNIGKNTVFRDFLPFRALDLIFFLLTYSLLTLSLLCLLSPLLHLSIWSLTTQNFRNDHHLPQSDDDGLNLISGPHIWSMKTIEKPLAFDPCLPFRSSSFGFEPEQTIIKNWSNPRSRMHTNIYSICTISSVYWLYRTIMVTKNIR